MVMVLVREEHAAELPSSAKYLPKTARELFDALPEIPGFRAEVIEGTLIVSPIGTPEHAGCAMDLHEALRPLLQKEGWRGYTGIVDVCIDGPRDPVCPDYVLAPADCPRWGDRELRSSGLIMVAEVVSPTSRIRDHEEKPAVYARGGIPFYLVIDPLAKTVTLMDDIVDGVYTTTTKAALGAKLYFTYPMDFELDTSLIKV
ncbi:Uma2 family endonuclease [Nonomuraea africana]|uniref:Uma2 family endonuclease n=1 Tax=Nonomuraea africana TaxID=46171 RepID=A0ABR9K816_9ACTN|nr:Uma2 family endonuclease [Nonomuraea africana]MBE1558137.1 Uma2 family endonuclease [Nonomuraea africana]